MDIRGAQSARDLHASNALEWAATLAFYAFLPLFPLLLAGMILASSVTDAAWATRQATELLGHFLSGGQGEIERIIKVAIADRQRAGIISLVILLFTGRRVLGALTKGLTCVRRRRAGRPDTKADKDFLKESTALLEAMARLRSVSTNCARTGSIRKVRPRRS